MEPKQNEPNTVSHDTSRDTKHRVPTLDNLTTTELIRLAKASTINAIKAGKSGMARELENLLALEARLLSPPGGGKGKDSPLGRGEGVGNSETDDDIGIPERFRLKRHYTMTPAALEVRRKGGKARAAKFPAPNWKHGKYAQSFIVKAIRPCKSTCRDYPCTLIDDGSTKPGEPCLDKSAVIQMYQALNDAIKHKKYDDFNEIASLTIAQSMHTLHMLLEDVIRDGPTLKREKHGSDGKVIGYDYVTHPALLALPKMIADLGMTPQEFMATPRAIAKQGSEEEGAETLAQFLSNLGTKMQKKTGIQKNTNE